MKKQRLFVAGLALAVLASGVASAQAQAPAPINKIFDKYRPVTDEMVLKPDAGDWLNWRGTLDLKGYSPLAQVGRLNVKSLELAWVFPMAAPGLNEVAPLVHDGVMFIATNSNIVQAVDAASGELIWAYRPTLKEIKGGYHTNQIRRQKNSISLYKDKVYLTTVDSRIIALEAKSGKVVWEKQALPWEKGYSYTAGPFIVKGKIVSGTSGCSITGTKGGCYVLAHDAETGEELWRVNTLSDPTRPEVEESWRGIPPENRWGASPWTTGSYDPETNTTYWGTGMPIPYPEIIRGTKDGDVLYTNSTLAIDFDTGKIKWYFQHMPRDNWDVDSPFERMLLDTRVGGKATKMLFTLPGKYAVAFGLDRTTGKFLYAKDTVYQNVIASIDPQTGKVSPNTKIIPTAEGQEVLFCPSISGGKLWQAMSYSPQTNAVYAPLAETCQTLKPRTTDFLPGEAVGSITAGPRVLPPNGQTQAGALFAIDASTGNHLWVHRQKPIISGSVLTTGGGLVFAGDAARYLMALDQKDGKVLWKVRLNAPIGGYMMTYMVNGVQYIAVPTGDNSQASSAAALAPETPYVSGANSLYVFKLRGK